MVFLFVLITFEPILDFFFFFFEVLDKSRNPRWRTKMVRNDYAIIVAIAFVFSELRRMRGGGGRNTPPSSPPPRHLPPVVEGQKQPGLNRVRRRGTLVLIMYAFI